MGSRFAWTCLSPPFPIYFPPRPTCGKKGERKEEVTRLLSLEWLEEAKPWLAKEEEEGKEVRLPSYRSKQAMKEK